MTSIGKILVLVNLAISLVLATLAFGVYSSGLDWSNNKAKSGQPGGKLDDRIVEITRLKSELSLAYGSWVESGETLWKKEDERRTERAWYAQELYDLRAGKGQVKMVARNRVPGATVRPGMEPHVDGWLSMAAYDARLAQVRADTAQVRKELDAKIEEDKELTNLLAGSADGKTKGLRQLLREEYVKKDGLRAEVGIVEGLRINRLVESELILKRLDAINERIGELEAYIKLKGGVDTSAKGR